jgi:hypothetical protein
MRSDHGLATVTAVGRYRWSDHQPGTGDSDQTGPATTPRRSCWVVRRLLLTRSCWIAVDADSSGMSSVTRYGLLPW